MNQELNTDVVSANDLSEDMFPQAIKTINLHVTHRQAKLAEEQRIKKLNRTLTDKRTRDHKAEALMTLAPKKIAFAIRYCLQYNIH